MKIASLLNKTNLIILLVCVGILAALALFFGAKENVIKHSFSFVYHQSQWNEFAPDVERALISQKEVSKINLDHVYGGLVPHHIPTTIPHLVNFYSRLEKSQTVKNIIVIGPDHTDGGKNAVSVSNAHFFTRFGELKPIAGLAEDLKKVGLAAIDEEPFPPEHSVGSQILVISKIFPGARVTPIILRSDVSREQAESLGKKLATYLGEETVLIASVDFSHYLTTDQARPIDQISGEIVRNLDLNAVSLVEADSNKSTAVFIAAMKAKNASVVDSFSVTNTNDFMQNSDYTTGYVTGYWGVRKTTEENNLIFVGDIMLSRAIGAEMKKRNDWKYHFEHVSDFLKKGALTIGNLETPISERGVLSGSIYSFRSDPKTMEGLLDSGFDILSVANNHSLDYGRVAYQDTLDILKKNNIDPIGGGNTYTDAHGALIKEVGKEKTKIAFLAYTNLVPISATTENAKPAIAYLDKEQMVKDIKEAKSKASIVVLSLHWGEEYQTKHNSFQEDIAKAVIDAGADLVIGHHPHVVQEVEAYKDGFIAYSLGNFIFDQNFSEDTGNGLVLKVGIQNDKISKVEKLKVTFSSTFQPLLENESGVILYPQ